MPCLGARHMCEGGWRSGRDLALPRGPPRQQAAWSRLRGPSKLSLEGDSPPAQARHISDKSPCLHFTEEESRTRAFDWLPKFLPR